MFRPAVVRQAAKALSQSTRPTPTTAFLRPLTSTAPLRKDARKSTQDPLLAATTTAPGGALEAEGQYARTDEKVKIEYPDDEHMPRSPVVQGRGGMHFKRTLAHFSLENKVTLVTGGARGLGLVMAQAIVASGSDLAIVDLNSRSCPRLGWAGLGGSHRSGTDGVNHRAGGRRTSEEAGGTVPERESRIGGGPVRHDCSPTLNAVGLTLIDNPAECPT